MSQARPAASRTHLASGMTSRSRHGRRCAFFVIRLTFSLALTYILQIVDAVHAKGSYIYLQIWALGRAARPALLHKLGAIVPLEHVTTLYFDPDDHQPGLRDWLDACTALPKLRKLGITGRGFPSLCLALEPHAAPGLLGDDDGASGDSRRSAVVLPDLKELVLRRVWMHGRQGVGDAENNLTALRAMLAARDMSS